MRLWLVQYPTHHDDTALSREWFATKREAERHAREGDGDFRLVEVPTFKPALVEFLNREAS